MGMRIFTGGWVVVSLLGGSASALSLASGSLAGFFFCAGCTVLLTGACAAIGGLVHMIAEEEGEEESQRLPRSHNIRFDYLEVIEVERRP